LAHRIGAVQIGTSGWSYDHWNGVFYPEHLRARERLRFYAEHFSTVEIDGTFYRLPAEKTVQLWHDSVPPDFRFAAKGSRFITHYRRLAGIEVALPTFMRRMSLLGEKLAVVLWQLPPTLACDAGLLIDFLEQIPPSPVRHAMEFRHESWLGAETSSALRAHNVARVQVSSDQMPSDFEMTADFAYVRFHGTAEYHGAYERSALGPWSEFLRREMALGHDCYAYFNNDAQGHAPTDAMRLKDMVNSSQMSRERG